MGAELALGIVRLRVGRIERERERARALTEDGDYYDEDG